MIKRRGSAEDVICWMKIYKHTKGTPRWWRINCERIELPPRAHAHTPEHSQARTQNINAQIGFNPLPRSFRRRFIIISSPLRFLRRRRCFSVFVYLVLDINESSTERQIEQAAINFNVVDNWAESINCSIDALVSILGHDAKRLRSFKIRQSDAGARAKVTASASDGTRGLGSLCRVRSRNVEWLLRCVIISQNTYFLFICHYNVLFTIYRRTVHHARRTGIHIVVSLIWALHLPSSRRHFNQI